MDEDVGAKAPVTRLRRRLSVEQSEDVKSPAAPLTPTKKRGGRLAAVPQLELINENATALENSPVKRAGRKSLARDVVEEEKPLTPGRRSTRIKSNTSIVSETPQSFDSPRAKRAARRNSQLGSDSEAPVTPARTRRVRKDSISSIDKPVENTPASIPLVEPINEEPENDSRKSTSNNEELNKSSQSTTTVRKSPRIQAKKGNKSSKENDFNTSGTKTDVSEELSKKKSANTQDVTDSATKLPLTETLHDDVKKPTDCEITSSQIEDCTESKEKIPVGNKSMSNTDASFKGKRNRTKSWTTITVPSSNDSSFLSDNEVKKKKVKNLNKSIDIKSLLDKSGSGDSQFDNGKSNVQENMSTIILNTSKTKRLSESKHDNSIRKSSILNNSDKENFLDSSPFNGNPHTTALLFDEDPSNELQTMVYIEDSDSKSSTGTVSTKQNYGGDQLVPVVKHQADKSLNNQNLNIANQEVHNDSCEPMDIDETIPENTSLIVDGDSDTSNKIANKSRRKSSISVHQNMSLNASKIVNESFNKSLAQEQYNTLNESVSIFNQSGNLNKSKRKSSIHLPKDDETATTPSGLETSKIKESLNKSRRKSSISQTIDKNIVTDPPKPALEISMNKSSKKSSMSNNEIDNIENSISSKRKSSLSQTQHTISSLSQSLNKSKRRSSINLSDDHETSLSHKKSESKKEFNECQNTEIDTTDSSKPSNRNSSISHSKHTEMTLEEINVSVNKSKRKSSISQGKNEKKSMSGADQSELKLTNDSLDKSKRKSSLTHDSHNNSLNDSNLASEQVNENFDTSKKNSLIQNVIGKSKIRKSSMSQLEKTDNENKSTLILSQLKDTSNDENNVSKSLNITDVKENLIINKNSSINNCLTSTPLQQKSVPKLYLKSASKSLNESMLNNSKHMSTKDVSMMSANRNDKPNDESSSNENEESESDENSSNEKSKLLDDEAEGVSDDYESGDSQDEDERKYADENEIVERGETLTSDDEFSDDTDYEKDSFIVTSDDEGSELLSGSGDDLSMSDNELNMSAKSKKKYDDRKRKEQKQASREMFESRHKLNTANNRDKLDTKKNKANNRSRLDSTLLKSEDDDDNVVKTKKSNRLRLNSTQESNASQSDADESIKIKKKKTKRLSESVCNESYLNEKEITICNDNPEATNDPLSGNIKQEPKTPAKDFNLSTVHFTDREEIEQVAVSGKMSVIKANETTDPLQASMADEDGSSSDISENQEITENYETMLNELNKATKRNLKTHDISLNLNKKSKQMDKEPIIDELNLTQTKIIKKNSKVAKLDSMDSDESKASSRQSGVANVDEGSSDSIDMKLLFPEDSNDSEKADVEDFIPLRKSEGKTNIQETFVQCESLKQTSLDESLKRKKDKKHKTSICPEETKDASETEVLFVVDTAGAKAEMNTSLSKKKKKENSSSFVNEPATVNENADNIQFIVDTEGSNSKAETSFSKKKHKKISISFVENAETPNGDCDGPLEVSFKSEKNLKKARKLSSSVADTSSKEPENVEGMKSKKRKRSSYNTEDTEASQDSLSTDIRNKKQKKSQDVPILTEVPTKKNKKRKEREDDDNLKTVSKVLKQNSFDDIHVSRLPTAVLNKLADKPSKDLLAMKKTSVVSTTDFVVEETKKRRNKPSSYLEESIYLNDDTPPKKKQKGQLKIPKVLPFIPTASTSDCGSTTKFEIKIIPQPTAFVAQPIEMANFKKDYLHKKIKKHGTYELYKRNRNVKISKF